MAATISSVNSSPEISFGTYFVIVTCRNSQDTIGNALASIKHQTINPAHVIVVNDGSKDKTKEILDGMRKDWPCLYVINKPDLGYDISRVVNNWNTAIKFAREMGLPETDYHMIATDDTIYPVDYAQKIISSMDSNPSLVIASGNYAKYETLTPHGAGRFIRNSFFEKTIWQGHYPQQMGYESAILYEARRSGNSYVIIENAKFVHTKPLGESHKFYEFGASMRTLGYHPICVLARVLKCFITGKFTGRIGALYMLYYYLTYSTKASGYNQPFDENMRNYVRANQLRGLRRIICKLINRAPTN